MLADADGEALVGWCMQLSGDVSREDNLWVMTDHRGRFVFPSLPSGKYRLSVMYQGRAESGGPDEFEVRSGETAHLDVARQ